MASNVTCFGVGRKNRLFLWDRICILICIAIFSPNVDIFRSCAASKVVFQNHQVMVTSLGCCYR